MIRLVREPIDIKEFEAVSPADGALCLFLGAVRSENAGKQVLHLEYEAYEEMALTLMQEIAAEAKRRWKVTSVRLVHRVGRLDIGEASVAIAATAPHRGEAFDACHYLIDALKATVPIWKREFYADGAVWLEGPGACATDHHHGR